jgi:hypothetical protein
MRCLKRRRVSVLGNDRPKGYVTLNDEIVGRLTVYPGLDEAIIVSTTDKSIVETIEFASEQGLTFGLILIPEETDVT